ncbi:MAG: tyrosine-type recombinase/integrase [Tannerellaceae bacterium]
MKHSFHSAMASQFDAFVLSRKAVRRWNKVYDDNLHFFDNYCAKYYPGQDSLNEGMLEWCKERPTEHGNSCKYRISAVIGFVKYANREGWTTIAPPVTPSEKPCLYIPHSFTQEELIRLFEECDKHAIASWGKCNALCRRLNKFELPIYFRLLYSTGMRTNEARYLRRKDIDFTNGVIEINETKGFDQHRVALHPSMLEMLKKYDDCMARIMPNRKMFFPNKDDEAHTPHSADYHFRQIWAKICNEPARPYDLRSHYAVLNITAWKGLGYGIHDKLLYLSRTMGHRSLTSTYWYFNLSPGLADKIKECSEESFNSLLPKLEDYEEEC